MSGLGVTVLLFVAVGLLDAKESVSTLNSQKIQSGKPPVEADGLMSLILRLTDDVKRLQIKVGWLERLEYRVQELEELLERKSQLNDDSSDESDSNSEEVDATPLSTNNEDSDNDQESKESTASLPRGIRQNPEQVAFSAVNTQAKVHLGIKQTIKFDHVILNTGGGYSPNSGVFTTPTAGTYLFLYNVGHHGTGETWLEIVKNNVRLNGIAVEGTGGSQNLQGSNSVIVDLAQGDEVWVEVFQVADVTLQDTFTTFSGVMLS